MSIAKQSGDLQAILTQLDTTKSLADLYTKKGCYLRCYEDKDGSKTWKSSPVALKSSEMDSQLNFIVHELCIYGLSDFTPSQKEQVAQRVNTYFFPKTPFNTKPDEEGAVITFNSKIEGGKRLFLSNMCPTLLVDQKGDFWNSVETCYHHQVLLHMEKPEISTLPSLGTPGKLSDVITVKKYGERQQREYFKALPTQDEKKSFQSDVLDIMRDLIKRKFTQSPRLQTLLLETGSVRLAERSTTDHFYAEDDQGIGNNHLGKILMQTRNDLN